MHLDGVFLAVFLLFAKHIEYNFEFFTQKGIQRLFILEFCSDFLDGGHSTIPVDVVRVTSYVIGLLSLAN